MIPMTLPKIIFTALGGACSVIILLIASWAQSLEKRAETMDMRVSTIEQHYASIDAKQLADHELLEHILATLDHLTNQQQVQLGK